MAHVLKGSVQRVSATGDLITDISNEQIADAPSDDSVVVTFGPHHTLGIYDPDHEESESTLLAVRGTSGNLELTIVGISLSEMLGIGPGEKVEIKW
ncbi:MAG TPA: adenosylmethionine-8-amino-7-oxononanoate aminotransferase [Pirellulaceae bacterium]|nr:adenosylmethionine-8-amino-7-oxononanoate aminotransferase [Pirellulaceae bacterium]HMO92171.1 adenosylmethionine-8-amino-7-oxononanoate aminotransferase [Pirellulaceae bacterium]HMP68902.1 adenosylmethionine-8-amino-7-oxononanoate aminotransferase [Pirellulaceae bacterium]